MGTRLPKAGTPGGRDQWGPSERLRAASPVNSGHRTPSWGPSLSLQTIIVLPVVSLYLAPVGLVAQGLISMISPKSSQRNFGSQHAVHAWPQPPARFLFFVAQRSQLRLIWKARLSAAPQRVTLGFPISSQSVQTFLRTETSWGPSGNE